MNPIGLLIAGVGLFAIAGGLRDWPWFWNSRRAKTAIHLFGPHGARVFYVLLGVVLILAGIGAAVAD